MAKKSKYAEWTKEELIKRVEALEKRKKYGLVWDEERTKEKFDTEAEGKLPVLKEIKSKEIKTDPDKPTHILIEGDNYHALSVLNYTHEKAVDVIYIDPPYNTGAKDWKYNNNYVDENDPYRHSKWLSMMYKRLKLAKKLLAPRGVLICTIDENEHATVGMLIREMFLLKEIVCVTIVHNPGGIQGKNFSYCHEYAYFVYPKNGRCINLEERDENPDVRPLRNVSKGEHLRETAANCFYPIYIKDGKIVGFGEVCDDSFHPGTANILGKNGIIEVYPIDSQGNERKWVFARQTVESIKDELSVEFNKKRQIWDIIRKKTKFNYKTVWTDPKFNANLFGTQLLNNIVETKFPFPKSLYAVEECIKAVIHSKENAVVLDFFAGSGTTGHAVSKMNKQDGGNRQFILCTNNEENICNDVTYPRIKKIIKGYIGIVDNKNHKGLNGNLKYYRTSFVPSEPTDRNKERLTKEATDMLCLRENTFEFVLETGTFKIFKNKEHYTGIIFDQLSIPKFKKAVAKFEKKISVYVFSLGDDDFSDEFEDMRSRVRVCSIPEAILRVYRRIFK
ncbi:MAG: site-specific DNA-methyltransferase [Nitrospirae bacterium]|nr:site-specific DNA-methyltransferase [Nitrospirota bacterium]